MRTRLWGLLVSIAATDYADAQSPALFATGITAGDRFGTSADRASDFDMDSRDDLIVGAPGANASRGEISIISSASGSRILTQPGLITFGRLGQSVLTIDDLNNDNVAEFVVGEPGNAGPTPVGVVHVLDGSTLGLLRSISGPSAGARLGEKLVRLDDQTGDGLGEFGASAPGATGGIGAVLVIDATTGAIVRTIPGAAAFDGFGTGLGSMGDLSGDGRRELVIGSPGFDPVGLVGAGRIDVYDPVAGARILGRNGITAGEGFGFSCDGTLDLNQDQIPDFIGGAPTAAPGGVTGAGACRVVSGADGAIIASHLGSAINDAFGTVVAGLGDVDGDGSGDYACGSPTMMVGTDPAAGRIDVQSGAMQSLLYEFTGQPGAASIGGFVRDIGDINNDNRRDFLLGSPRFPSAGLDIGRIELRLGQVGDLEIDSSGQYGTAFTLSLQATPLQFVFFLVDIAPGSFPSEFGEICLAFSPFIIVVPAGSLDASGHMVATGTIPHLLIGGAQVLLQALVQNPAASPAYWASDCTALTIFP